MPLNVLQVVLGLAPGGTERLVIELVRRSHPDVAMGVCCLDGAGAWGNSLRNDGVTVEALGREAGFHPSLGRRIAQCATDQGATIIHCHHYSPFVYSSLARLWHPSLKIIFTEHGRLSDAAPSAKRRLANRVLARLPHQVFTVSADLKRHIVAEGFPEAAVGVIHNGIDPGTLPTQDARDAVRHALRLPDDAFVVGTVARLDPVKNLETLVRAVAALSRQRQAVLLVVGEGDERRHLEAVAAETGSADAVRFLGHRDDAREVLAGCDAYANSSISEGVSLTILEAMAAGLPVVATHVGGTPEVLDDTCARLVPSRNPEAMAAALAELASSPTLGERLGRAGRTRLEERFTLDRMVREYTDAYFRAAAA